ncbi:MAG: hypothetical protein R8M45_04495 [Ghiorsea sp.]
MKIIGIAGKARSGKDTVAGWIQTNLNARLYSLADPIKKAGSEMFGIPLDNFYNPEFKEKKDDFWKISPRHIAQILGTEVGRDMFFRDMWLKRAEMEINKEKESNDHIVFCIPDIRFENEANYIRNNDGFIIHVSRPSLGDTVVRKHVSENGVEFKPGDVDIYNDGSLEDLFRVTNISLNERFTRG